MLSGVRRSWTMAYIICRRFSTSFLFLSDSFSSFFITLERRHVLATFSSVTKMRNNIPHLNVVFPIPLALSINSFCLRSALVSSASSIWLTLMSCQWLTSARLSLRMPRLMVYSSLSRKASSLTDGTVTVLFLLLEVTSSLLLLNTCPV